MLALSLNVSAAIGDVIPLATEQIVEIKTETSTTSKGKQKVEYVVIYKDREGKRRMAYMTKSDYNKLERAKQYDVYVEYVLVEGKTRNKVTVK